MTAIPWLSSLPQAPLYDGQQETLGDNKASFQPDVGDPIERQRYTAASEALAWSFMMTAQQYRNFRAYYAAALKHGALPFRLYDGLLENVMDYKITSPPAAQLLAADVVRVSFTVLRKPS